MNPTGLLEKLVVPGKKETQGLFIRALLCSEHAFWEAIRGLSSGRGVLCQHHYGFLLQEQNKHQQECRLASCWKL